TSARRAGSATATTFGRKARACSTRTSVDELTPSPTISKWSRSARTTSIVCVPIDPDEPAIATRTVPALTVDSLPGRWSSGDALARSESRRREANLALADLLDPGLDEQGGVVRGRQGEEHPVEAVEDATVARKKRPEVLHVEVALEHRLGEITDRRDDHDD